GHGSRRVWGAVAVIDEPRDGGRDERRIQQVRQVPRHTQGTRIPGDMRLAGGGVEAECTELCGKGIRGMFADDQKAPRALRIADLCLTRHSRPPSTDAQAVARSRCCQYLSQIKNAVTILPRTGSRPG